MLCVFGPQGEQEEEKVDAATKAEREYFLSDAEHLHSADLMLFCVGGAAFVDVRHYPSGEDAWVRVHLKTGDMLLVAEGCYHRFVLEEAAAGAAASIVVLTTQAPRAAAKAQTPAAVQQWSKANGGEEQPSRARYHYLFVRPKPRWPLSLLEPTPDINYNYVVIEQLVMCGIGACDTLLLFCVTAFDYRTKENGLFCQDRLWINLSKGTMSRKKTKRWVSQARCWWCWRMFSLRR